MICCNKALLNHVTKVNFEKEIVFEDVKFSYSDDKMILKNFNVKIKKGNIIGVFGSSGKEKYFFDLLSGIQTPDTVEFFDGKDLKENIFGWQKVLGYTHQDTIILDDTLKNNIGIGNQKKVNELDLKSSIEISELSKFVSESKKGIDTQISEKGSNISGGQKQRIGIARTIYKKPEVLIFDEAFNSLDKKTCNKILENI